MLGGGREVSAVLRQDRRSRMRAGGFIPVTYGTRARWDARNAGSESAVAERVDDYEGIMMELQNGTLMPTVIIWQ